METNEEVMSVPSIFDCYDLKKGQTRGGGGGAFGKIGGLFSKKKVDASGQEDTVQIVGKFKGMITVETKKERARLQKERIEKIGRCFELINDICMKSTGKPFEITLDDLATNQNKRDEFKQAMGKFQIAHLKLLKTICDVYSEEMIAKQLLIEQ